MTKRLFLLNSFLFYLFLSIFLSTLAWSECTSCGDCAPPVIGFTSKQMSVNGNQTLTAIGGMSPFTWSMVGGGGILSGSSGASVTYTAPSSNADCALNPTIQITDYCGNKNTLILAINAYNGGLAIGESITLITGACQGTINQNLYGCDGRIIPECSHSCAGWYLDPTIYPDCCSDFNCDGDFYHDPSCSGMQYLCYPNACGGMPSCRGINCISYCGCYGQGWPSCSGLHDVRTTAKKMGAAAQPPCYLALLASALSGLRPRKKRSTCLPESELRSKASFLPGVAVRSAGI